MASSGNRFQGKRALVTGGSRGIGRGIVDGLVADGAEVLNFDLINLESSGVKTIQVDLSDWDATRKRLEDVGPIDLLVNNAGISHKPVNFVDMDKNVLDKVLAVNLYAPLNISQVVASEMIKNGKGGSIVNTSSIGVSLAAPKSSAYIISKGGLQMMTKCMALELGPHKIRVNSINPTVVMDTEMGKENWSDEDVAAPYRNRTPLGRFAEVRDVVKAVLFLLSDDSSLITGSAINVDGGISLS